MSFEELSNLQENVTESSFTVGEKLCFLIQSRRQLEFVKEIFKGSCPLIEDFEYNERIFEANKTCVSILNIEVEQRFDEDKNQIVSFEVCNNNGSIGSLEYFKECGFKVVDLDNFIGGF